MSNEHRPAIDDTPPIAGDKTTPGGFAGRVAAAVAALLALSALALSMFALAYCSNRQHPNAHFRPMGESSAAAGSAEAGPPG